MSRSATPTRRKPAPAKATDDVSDLDDLFPGIELPDKPWMPRKKGRTVHRSTAVRWMLYHVPKLKSVMVGGTRCTCRRWVMEFFEACTGADANPISESRQRKDHDDAERELDACGLK